METLGYFDEITTADLKALAAAEGPKVSIFLPTRAPEHTPQDTATRVKSLVNDARRKLINAGVAETDASNILADFDQLATSSAFLRHQGTSLALFAAPGLSLIFRTGVDLEEYTYVGEHFVLRPISEVLTASNAFYILALSRNKVRVFDATKESIVQLDLEDIIPGSISETPGIDDDNQTELQNRSVGGDRSMFHGHGGAADGLEVEVQKFIHEVGSSLGDLLGRARSQPLVVAGVAEVLPGIKASSTYPVVLDEMITGNPDQKSAADLQKAGWEVVLPRFSKADDADFEKFSNVAGTGRGETQSDLIRQAAEEGRVDTLFINPSLNASDGTGDVNRAILGTLLNSGKIVIISDGRVENVAALMRY